MLRVEGTFMFLFCTCRMTKRQQMFFRCVLCVMDTKHQEHITAANVDGNALVL